MQQHWVNIMLVDGVNISTIQASFPVWDDILTPLFIDPGRTPTFHIHISQAEVFDNIYDTLRCL